VCIGFSCLGLLSCITSCIFFCVVWFCVCTLAKWLAGKTYSRDIFRVEGFPLQRPDWRVIYCSVVYCKTSGVKPQSINQSSSVTPFIRDRRHWTRDCDEWLSNFVWTIASWTWTILHSRHACSGVTCRLSCQSAAHGDLLVPCTRFQLGKHAFAVAGPSSCSSLPTNVQMQDIVSTFKSRLKTKHLFPISNNCNWHLWLIHVQIQKYCLVSLKFLHSNCLDSIFMSLNLSALIFRYSSVFRDISRQSSDVMILPSPPL